MRIDLPIEPGNEMLFKQEPFLVRVTFSKRPTPEARDAVQAIVLAQLARTPLRANVELPLEPEPTPLAEALRLFEEELGRRCAR